MKVLCLTYMTTILIFFIPRLVKAQGVELERVETNHDSTVRSIAGQTLYLETLHNLPFRGSPEL